jgi:peptidoglycan hydrolase-like protein with peptidoglycan-binding domain
MTETLKQNKQALIYGLVLVALVIVYFKRDTIKDFFSKSVNSSSSNSESTANKTPSVVSNTGNDATILSQGSTGEQVRRLQQLLNNKNNKSQPTFLLPLVEDGNFGKKTETMLKKYTGKTSISINQLIKALI